MSKKTTDENRLTILYPKVAEEWHPTKNGELQASDVSYALHIKVWWKCKQGHEWESIISNRTRLGRKCPFCTHQKVIAGETDFASVCPEAAKEWHPTKNGNLLPEDVMCATHKKVWWLCSKCGYEWKTEVKTRYLGSGCPKCNNGDFFDVPTVGVDDLATKRADLIQYWNYEKNYPVTPSEIKFGSGKKVWWRCKNNHEYQMTVCNKAKGEGCPICTRRRRTSLPEQTVFFYVKKAFPDAINCFKEIFDNHMELDIYIPSLNTGIEYDGKVYHSKIKNRERDVIKYEICKAQGVRLIRIAHDVVNEKKSCDYLIYYSKHNNENLKIALIELLEVLGVSSEVDINIKRDKLEILSYLEALDISLESEFPDIAKEFNYEKNTGLFPSYFHAGSNERVWWKCRKCGHEWAAMISSRTKDGDGCPKCSAVIGGMKKSAYHLKQRGSIAVTHPELLESWNYEKNELLPTEITAGTARKVWWKCKYGHTWDAAVDHVSKRGANCPYCNNKRILTGYNDLLTRNPMLAAEWDYKKNNAVLPSEVGAGTARKAWWICQKCNYSWKASICSRNNGIGCPNCAHVKMRGNKYAKK